MVNIIGLNPDLARIANLVIQISHTCMYTRIKIWLNIGDGIRSGQLLAGTKTYITSLQFSCNPLAIELHENVEAIPRVRDLWLPMQTFDY